jgi:NADP-dependent 3-hydroxy acid dehydrogenase YdfG
MLQANNRVVMISGANRGIGLATAKTLGQAGYRLSLGVRDASSIDTDDFAGFDVMVTAYDATSGGAASDWVNATIERFGAVDALVLNAGVMFPLSIEDEDEDKLDLMWDVNFKGPLRLVRAAFPALKSSGHGRVVNVVSLSGKRVMGAGNLGYTASKFASLSLTHTIRQAGWADGIRATAICPGLVDTDMVSHVSAPDGEFKITPEAIAATAAYALSLPNEAVVAEVLVNSRLETML